MFIASRYLTTAIFHGFLPWVAPILCLRPGCWSGTQLPGEDALLVEAPGLAGCEVWIIGPILRPWPPPAVFTESEGTPFRPTRLGTGLVSGCSDARHLVLTAAGSFCLSHFTWEEAKGPRQLNDQPRDQPRMSVSSRRSPYWGGAKRCLSVGAGPVSGEEGQERSTACGLRAGGVRGSCPLCWTRGNEEREWITAKRAARARAGGGALVHTEAWRGS